jgi:hypothetical protein
MSAFDGNRDGYLNAFEMADANEFRFADANRDGALNFAEFSRVESNYQQIQSSSTKFVFV